MPTNPDDPDAWAETARAAGGVGVWSWDIAADVVQGDAVFARLLHLPVGRSWPGRLVLSCFADVDRLTLQSTLAKQEQFAMSCAVVNAAHWITLRGGVTDQGVADAAVMSGVIWDSTDQKAKEDGLTILASEMDHRVKNSFAVIRALISLALRKAPQHAPFGKALKAQVTAMATAHQVSARMARETADAASPVPLRQTLEIALAPWRADHDIRETVSADFALAPKEVSAIAMLIYELSMNAAKYGAFSLRGGHLSILGVETREHARMLVWTEVFNGPALPLTEDSENEIGFGDVLINHCASTLGATINQDLTAERLIVKLVLKPL